MAPQRVNALWDDTKDLGILVGKGGLYGSVREFTLLTCQC